MKGAMEGDRKKLESEFDSFMAELGEVVLHPRRSTDRSDDCVRSL